MLQMRLYGLLCAVLAAILACLYQSNSGAWHHWHDDLYILGYVMMFLAFAVPLLAGRVWAELIFVLCLALLSAVCLVAVASDLRSSPEVLFSVLPCAILLMIPVAIAVQRMRHGAYFYRDA